MGSLGISWRYPARVSYWSPPASSRPYFGRFGGHPLDILACPPEPAQFSAQDIPTAH